MACSPSPLSGESRWKLADAILGLGALGILGLLLFAALGPLATDDLWWHLRLGHVYLEAGPWLTADPRLHNAHKPAAARPA